MDRPLLTIAAIRRALQSDAWAFSIHTRERLGRRRITADDAIASLVAGEIIEEYPEDPRGPSALVLGYTAGDRPLHAVCAFDPGGMLVIITVYEPEPPRWLDDRTRGERREEH